MHIIQYNDHQFVISLNIIFILKRKWVSVPKTFLKRSKNLKLFLLKVRKSNFYLAFNFIVVKEESVFCKNQEVKKSNFQCENQDNV